MNFSPKFVFLQLLQVVVVAVFGVFRTRTTHGNNNQLRTRAITVPLGQIEMLNIGDVLERRRQQDVLAVEKIADEHVSDDVVPLEEEAEEEVLAVGPESERVADLRPRAKRTMTFFGVAVASGPSPATASDSSTEADLDAHQNVVPWTKSGAKNWLAPLCDLAGPELMRWLNRGGSSDSVVGGVLLSGDLLGRPDRFPGGPCDIVEEIEATPGASLFFSPQIEEAEELLGRNVISKLRERYRSSARTPLEDTSTSARSMGSSGAGAALKNTTPGSGADGRDAAATIALEQVAQRQRFVNLLAVWVVLVRRWLEKNVEITETAALRDVAASRNANHAEAVAKMTAQLYVNVIRINMSSTAWERNSLAGCNELGGNGNGSELGGNGIELGGGWRWKRGRQRVPFPHLGPHVYPDHIDSPSPLDSPTEYSRCRFCGVSSSDMRSKRGRTGCRENGL